MAFTSHGYHIQGTPMGRETRGRCGGPSMCTQCAREVIFGLNADLSPNLENVSEMSYHVEPETFVRKTFEVKAVQVTDKNMEDLAKWCRGQIRLVAGPETQPAKFIKLNIPRAIGERQTQAFVGDWVVQGRGFKFYTDHAFKQGFEKKFRVHDDNNYGAILDDSLVSPNCD